MSKPHKHYSKLEAVFAYLWKLSIHNQDINNDINYSVSVEIDGCTHLTNGIVIQLLWKCVIMTCCGSLP